MVLSHTASALAMHHYGGQQPAPDVYMRFYALTVELLEQLELSPTYFRAAAINRSAKLEKFGGRSHSRALEAGLSDVASVSISANPPGSDQPAFDSFFYAGMNYSQPLEEMLLCLVVNESIMRLFQNVFDQALLKYVALQQWDCGYAFAAPVASRPEFFILGMNAGQLSKEDERALNAWYASPPDIRRLRPRSVFSYNILSDLQLEAKLQTGKSLREFVSRDLGQTLEPLPSRGLSLWRVPNAVDVNRFRDILSREKALIV